MVCSLACEISTQQYVNTEAARVPELILELGSKIGIFPCSSPLSLISDKHSQEFQSLMQEMQEMAEIVDEEVINDMGVDKPSSYKRVLSIMDESTGFHNAILTLYSTWLESWTTADDPSKMELLDDFYIEAKLHHHDDQGKIWAGFRTWYSSFKWHGTPVKELDNRGVDCWIWEAIERTRLFTTSCIKGFFVSAYEELEKSMPEYNMCCFIGAALNSCHRCLYGFPFGYTKRGKLLSLLKHMNNVAVEIRIS